MKTFATCVVVFFLFLYTQTYEVIPKDEADEDETIALNEDNRVRKSLPSDKDDTEVEDLDRVKRSPDAQPKPRPAYYYYYYTYRYSYYTYRSYTYRSYAYRSYTYRSYTYRLYRSYRSYTYRSLRNIRTSFGVDDDDDGLKISIGAIVGISIGVVCFVTGVIVFICIMCCR